VEHPRIAITVGDGRALLAAQAPGAYDVIALDAFGVDDLPRRLASEEMFALCRERLRPGGALAVNVAGTFAGAGTPRRLLAGVAAAFGAERTRAHGVPLDGERALPVAELRGPRNTIVLARRDAALPSPAELAARAAELPPWAGSVVPALTHIANLAYAQEAHVLAPLSDPTHDPDERLPVR